jgi:hypothetical protein|tara:strand:+ start:552 stop:890 length:339 start_codon:yes stop_codon:yes gene_type:complete
MQMALIHLSILVGQEVVQLLLRQLGEKQEAQAPLPRPDKQEVQVVDQEKVEVVEQVIPLQQIPLKEIQVVIRYKDKVAVAVQEALVDHKPQVLVMHQELVELVRIHGQEIVH